VFHLFRALNLFCIDPRWANPIKNMVRKNNQARAVNEVVNALKPTQTSRPDELLPPLRVMNGMSITTTTTTSSIITTAAHENVRVSPVVGFSGLPANSTVRWGGGLSTHPEHDREDYSVDDSIQDLPVPRKQITPSLATLEKAVSTRIFFENLYFPLLRHPPSREQRRIAMERDMANMRFSEAQKEGLRAQWRQNETDYLRQQRKKVDVSAFVKLKTIGHGTWFHLF
jgi:protein-serine/threonine kinase